MKIATILAAAVLAFASGAAHAEEFGTLIGHGSTRMSACADAKTQISNLAYVYNLQITYVSSCDCEGDSNDYSSRAWYCSADYKYYAK